MFISSRLLAFLLPVIVGLGATAQQQLRLPAWIFNTQDAHIVGVSVGYWENQQVCNVTTDGIRLEAPGLGFFLFMAPYITLPENDSSYAARALQGVQERVNGINLSALGSLCDCTMNGINLGGGGTLAFRTSGITASLVINAVALQQGVQLAGWNMAYRVDGLQLGVMANSAFRSNGVQLAAENYAERMRGLQIGVVNKATDLKGVQIGLWNVNGKRKLPLINWS